MVAERACIASSCAHAGTNGVNNSGCIGGCIRTREKYKKMYEDMGGDVGDVHTRRCTEDATRGECTERIDLSNLQEDRDKMSYDAR